MSLACPKITSLSCLMFVLSVILILPLPAQASSIQNIQVTPPFQEIDITESTTATVNYTNNTNYPINMEFKAVAIEKFDILGRIVFDQSINQIKTIIPPDHLGIYPRSAVINSNDTTQVSISLEAEQLNPGGNYIMLLGIQKTDSVPESGLQSVEQALASVVLIKQPNGVIQNLQISGLSWTKFPLIFRLPTGIQLTLSNTGNIHLTPRGTIESRDLFDRTLSRGYINQSSLYIFPGNTRQFSIDLKRLRLTLPITPITLYTTTYDHNRQTQDQNISKHLYISPLLFLIPIVIILLLKRPSLNQFLNRVRK